MKLNRLIVVFIALWVISAITTLWFGDIAKAASFGDSFGSINALFSGIALALAVYSMVLQQQQNAEFESKTLSSMQQQAQTIELIKSSLIQQSDMARITALTYLIEREEQKVETLKEWGRKKCNDENHYAGGIRKAQERIERYQQQVEATGLGSKSP